MRSRVSRQVLVAMVAAHLGFMYTNRGWAASSATFHLQAQGCGDGTTQPLRQSLSIELAAKHVAQSIANSRVNLRCDALRAMIVVDDRLTQKQVNRYVDLSGSDELAWSRLLAVAIAETIRWSWAEARAAAYATARAGPELSIPPAAAPREVVKAATPATLDPGGSGVELAVCILRLNNSGSVSGLWGAAVRVMRRFGPIEAALDSQFATGQIATPRVLINSDLASVAVMAGPHLHWQQLALGLQLGGRAGVALLSGQPADDSLRASSLRASWGGPLARAAVTAKLLKRLRVGAAAEAGWVLRPVTGSIADEQDVQWRGGWWSLQLSMGFAFQ